MKKLLVSVLALCAFTAAVACDGPGVRVGTAGPNSAVRIFGVTADPSVADGGGQNAMIGSIAQMTTTGLSAWVKYGSADTAWQPFPGTTTPVAGIAEVTYTTPAVDLTAVAATQLTPVAPTGYIFVPVRLFMVVATESGTWTGAPSVQVGNNGTTYNNLLASTALVPSAAIANLGAGSETNSAVGTFLMSAPAYFVNVTAAATGGTTLTARYSLVGYWQPLP